jgi:hypothetical protein
MDLIRKIVREELRRALSEIYSQTAEPSSEEIIYDFEAGRSFGVNKLARDIEGLDQYYMNSYFPKSEMEESWMFEIDAQYGSTQLVEITHKLKSDYESYWKLDLSEVERGSEVPSITNSTGFVQGYDNFVRKVNSDLGREINPDLL